MSSSVPDDYCWWDIEWTDGVPWFHVWQEVTLNMPHLRVWQKHTSVELTVLHNLCYLWQWHTGVVQRCSNLFIPGCDFTTLLNHLLPRLSFSVICICPQWSCSGSAVHVYVRAFLICLHLHDMVFSSLWKICLIQCRRHVNVIVLPPGMKCDVKIKLDLIVFDHETYSDEIAGLPKLAWIQ